MDEEMEREVNFNADHFVTRYEMQSRHGYERELSAQRMEIANLKAEKVSDLKDIELYKQFRRDLKEELDPIKDDVKYLQNRMAAQEVWNTAQQGAMHSMRNDIDDLLHLTRRHIPRRYICPPIEDPVEP